MEENITLFSIQQKSEKDEKHEFAFKTRKKKTAATLCLCKRTYISEKIKIVDKIPKIDGKKNILRSIIQSSNYQENKTDHPNKLMKKLEKPTKTNLLKEN